MKIRFALLLLCMTFFAGAWLAAAPSAASVAAGMPESLPAQQANVVPNPGLERPYNNGVADGWAPWHNGSPQKPGDLDCGNPDTITSYRVQPHWSEENNQALVTEGFSSQHIGNLWDTWGGGIFKTVTVTPGSSYRFSFWAIGRASPEQFPAPSDTSIPINVRAGIDPNGSGLWLDSDVVWGAAGSPHDGGNQANWQQFSVEATATAAQISVFMAADFGSSPCRAKHYDVWFDQAQLVEAGPPPTNTPPPQPTLPPPPPATNTPIPTATPEATATATATPTSTPTDTATPVVTGIICVNAFADENSNGQHEAEEGAMAGVTFSVARDGDVVRQGVSTGPEPICFDDLEPGNYQVAQSVPQTLEMTTGASADISLSRGQSVEVKFGSRVRPQEALSSNDTPASETVSTEPDEVVTVDDADETDVGGGTSLLALSGLAALVVAIVMMGVLIFLLLRQRSV